MLSNIKPVKELRGLALVKGRDYIQKTVKENNLNEGLQDGWTIYRSRRRKGTVTLRKTKATFDSLEDRVWTLLYKMGFDHLSGENGALLGIDSNNGENPKTQIDVVGIDDEVALAVECKSAAKLGTRPQFAEELGKHSLIRERFASAINTQFPSSSKRQALLVMFMDNTVLSEKDRVRAKDAGVAVFDGDDLKYYENLTKHLGPAARFQLLSDMLPGKPIPGLEIRVPAIRTKMGGYNCYVFSISPEYLLKIAYVSHRAKSRDADIETYQRMISKSRLNKIKDYIKKDGIFPTNIVINFDKQRVRFERIHQETASDFNTDEGLLGWLDIRPAYKTAWIIDGQHRLYAYSGLKEAAKSLVSILAFEGLPKNKQAILFIDINAKQKRVKQSLLEELYKDFHWDATGWEDRIKAIVSRAISYLSRDPDSALFKRIQSSDATKDERRCISFTSIFAAIQRGNFFVLNERNGQPIEFGPLWATTNEDTMERTVDVLGNWFKTISDNSSDWWEKGSGEGGGLAMNDGVSSCISVLRSVFQHLENKGIKLVGLTNDELTQSIDEYGIALGKYLGSLTEEERKQFRSLRTAEGVITRVRRCQKGIQISIPSFSPPGLVEFLEQEKEQTNVKAKETITQIERTLQKTVIQQLRKKYGEEESGWWLQGVPRNIRLNITKRFEEDDGKRGGKEYYFDLIDYRRIALDDWLTFGPLLAYPIKGNKEDKTDWIDFVNQKRNIVAHASSGVTVSTDDLKLLNDYWSWLSNQTSQLELLN